MCLAIYLGSNTLLPSVRKVDDKIGFYTRELQGNENFVYQHFTKKFIFYVGSAEGCSCGFLMDGIFPDMEEYLEVRETYFLFSKFLMQDLDENEFEIYACWGGEEAETPVQFNNIKVSDLSRTDFSFEEKHFYKIENY